MLFDAFESFITSWAEKILATGKIEFDERSLLDLDFDLPNDLLRFYRMDERWPFFELTKGLYPFERLRPDNNNRITFVSHWPRQTFSFQNDGVWETAEADLSLEGIGSQSSVNLARILVGKGLDQLTRKPWASNIPANRTLTNWILEDTEDFYAGAIGEIGGRPNWELAPKWVWKKGGFLIQIHKFRNGSTTLDVATTDPEFLSNLLHQPIPPSDD